MLGLKYLIKSSENNCVYTYTPRPLTANALIAGDGDSSIKGVYKSNFSDYDKIKDRDMFFEKIYMIDSLSNRLVELSDANVSDSWKNQRILIRARQSVFTAWEVHASSALARITRRIYPQFDILASQELLRCDVNTGQYTPAIDEYARTLGITPDRAVKELKLQIESDNSVYFRIQALADKWKIVINNTTNIDDFSRIRQSMTQEFWQNSYI